MNHEKPRLISIVGPTAVGKTKMAIEMAKLLKTEIISADSRQFYKEMAIGTAKPSTEELMQIKHHFIDSHSVETFYSAGDFERDALDLLSQLFQKHETVVAVGGSGLYLKALWEGFDEMPKIKEGVRDELNKAYTGFGLKPLLIELKEKDPKYHGQVDQKNHQRVIRALEIIRSTNQPYSSFRKGEPKFERPFENVKIGLEMDRENLNERIDFRMDQMIDLGLFQEAEKLCPFRNENALRTVGYKEIFDFLDEEYDRQEAIRLLKRNSRRYAKRQMTWFKADPEVHWFDSNLPAQDILTSLHIL